MNIILKLLIGGLVILPMTFSSCTDENQDEVIDNGQKKVDIDLLEDPNRSFSTTFDGKLFSVPSPIQTALLIKSTKVDYNEGLLNPESNLNKYNSNWKKALNLGVYGSDLGYATLYNQNAKALSYLNAIESLSNDLGISGAFDASFLSRFEANGTNEDSMLVIITDAFRKGDKFLKNNSQNGTSALILTGGWIESMYFATTYALMNKDKKIFQRIGEQKQTLKTIIDILETYNRNNENDILISQLKSLSNEFNQIKFDYEYVEPVTDENRRLTTIQCVSNCNLTDELESSMQHTIAEIRALITENPKLDFHYF